jgi:hypothetical protein
VVALAEHVQPAAGIRENHQDRNQRCAAPHEEIRHHKPSWKHTCAKSSTAKTKAAWRSARTKGLKIDGVIAAVLMNEEYRGLYGVIDRHRLRKSKLQMAKELNQTH